MRRSLEPLQRFPRLGVEIPRPGSELRFLVGPWRWLVVVYVYFVDEDRVVVVTVEDGRSATAATGSR